MVKQKEDAQAPDVQEELRLLRETVKKLEAKSVELEERGKKEGFNAYNEIQNIRSKGKDTSSHIQYKDTKNYVPVTLWQLNGVDVGRPRGPFHPSNAEDAFLRFSKINIVLSTRKPTMEEIERYQSGDEYKKLKAEHDRLRVLKDKTKKSSEVERLAAEISRLTGQVIENRIKSPEEVSMKK